MERLQATKLPYFLNQKDIGTVIDIQGEGMTYGRFQSDEQKSYQLVYH
jgi:hypothetical protein